MFADPADKKLKSEATTPQSLVNVRQRFLPRGVAADQSVCGSRLLLGSKMADGGEEVVLENHKTEEEIELDLGKCTAEFAQYCQVDVRNEVWYTSVFDSK